MLFDNGLTYSVIFTKDHASSESEKNLFSQSILDRTHTKVAILQLQLIMAEGAYNKMIRAAAGFKAFALIVHEELKEETEQLELRIRIGRGYGIFNSTCDVCPSICNIM